MEHITSPNETAQRFNIAISKDKEIYKDLR